MEQDFLQALNCLGSTAVFIRDGSIVWVSDEARHLGVDPADAVSALLPADVTEADFSNLREFSLPEPWTGYYAKVCPIGRGWLLAAFPDTPPLDYAALAQTSKILREPMEDIMSVAESLFARLEELEDPVIQSQTASLSRSFYRLLRTEASLTDLERSRSVALLAEERIELRRWLRELSDPLCSAIATTGKTLEVDLPKSRLYAEIDAALLEQALLCLLSNAIRYSPASAHIHLLLMETGEQSIFVVDNPISAPVSLLDLSGGFTRIVCTDADHGLGLGLLRVQNAAKRLGGALLLECTPDGMFRANLCIPLRQETEEMHIYLPEITEGGYNRMLVELSDVLPDTVFDSRNL